MVGGLDLEVKKLAQILKIRDRIEFDLIDGILAIASSTNKAAVAKVVEFACKNNNIVARVIEKYL